MESIISVAAALISIGCAIYCTFQVNIIKNNNKNNGDRNVQMNHASDNFVNTGDKGGSSYDERS